MLKREVYNATSIPSINGGGNHGHLTHSCPLPTAVVAGANGVPFDEPIAPILPDLNNMTVAQSRPSCHDWTSRKEEYKSRNKRRCFKKQILEAVHKYLQSLADDLLGFTNVARLPCLTLADTRCLSPRRFKTTSPSSAFHGIRIRPSKRFSPQLLLRQFATAGGDPISDATTREVLKTFNLVSLTLPSSNGYVQAHGRSHL
jgi:hypothetical protein